MLKIVLNTAAKDKAASLKELNGKVASYLYSCTDWKYTHLVFDNSLVVITDFGLSKMLSFVSVLRDICNHSDVWFVHSIEYDC